MRKGHAIAAAFAVACLLATSACGARPGDAVRAPAAHAAAAACHRGSAFALSLASDRGGRRSPVRAASWFARHGGVRGIPQAGWRQVSRTGKAAVVRSGMVTLHVIQGPDRTWQVDSGHICS
jgi:hypothetical protein